MTESITPWIHIVAVSAWLGPQFLLALAIGPALRSIEDPQARLRALRIITYRFGLLAWAALAVIVLSGLSNLFQEADEFGHVFDSDFRYFHIFLTKMVLLGVMVLLTVLHNFVIGPQVIRLQEEMRFDAEALRLQRGSVIISYLILLFSVAIVFVGALLGNHEFSFQPT